MQINQKTERSSVLEKLMGLTAAFGDKLSVSETEMTDKSIFTVKCDDRDYGRIVGTRGVNVMAWSDLAAAMCLRSLSKTAEVIVAEPSSRNVHPADKYKSNPKWGVPQLKPLVLELSGLLFDRGAVEVNEVGQALLVASITAMDDSIPFDEFKIASAISRVFRCIGGAQGRKVEVELIYRPLPDTSGR